MKILLFVISFACPASMCQENLSTANASTFIKKKTNDLHNDITNMGGLRREQISDPLRDRDYF
jgi:hypothetical protein